MNRRSRYSPSSTHEVFRPELEPGTAKQESLPRIANGTINPGYRDVDWVFSKHTVHQRPQQPRGQVMSTFCSPDREVEDDDITDRSVFTDNIYEDMNPYKT